MQNIRVKISNRFIIIICFLLITGCTNSSYIERLSRQSQCLPPPFQTTESLDPVEESYRRVDMDKPIQEISGYYLDVLTPVEVKKGSVVNHIDGDWYVHELPEPKSGKLFDCYNSIDRLTKETGCIFLHMKDEEETTIEFIWNLGELAPGCSSLLEQ